VSRLLTDVERLCTAHLPRWLATPGMDAAKIAQFYDDPAKQASDARSSHLAHYRRSLTVDESLRWEVRRRRHFLKRRLLAGPSSCACQSPFARRQELERDDLRLSHGAYPILRSFRVSGNQGWQVRCLQLWVPAFAGRADETVGPNLNASRSSRLLKNSPASFRKPSISGSPEIECVIAKSATATWMAAVRNP